MTRASATRRPATPRRGLRAKLHRDEGQSLVFIAVCMVILLGFLGLVLDVGKVYIAQRQLQTATDAAALAAAQLLPDANAAMTTACQYGATDGTISGDPCNSSPNGQNNAGLSGVKTTLTPECLSIATTGISCIITPSCPADDPKPPNNQVGCNAIKVTEEVSVQPWLLGILNVGNTTVTATSTASMAGGSSVPLDVEMINDTTASMQTNDTCGGLPTDVPSSALNNLTQEDCAKAGIRALLTNLQPCTIRLGSCNPQSGAATDRIPTQDELDLVGMVTFPGLTSGHTTGLGVAEELNCTQELDGNDVSYASNANYQIVPFSSDYRYSDIGTADPLATLYPKSKLVQSVYWAGDGCPNGGYPTNTGGSISSISGGNGGDMSTANNDTPAIGGGAASSNSSANTANAAVIKGNSTFVPTAATSGITVGNSNVNSTSGLTIGGGPGGGNGDRSTKTGTNAMSIGLNMPTSTATGDFVMVTVTGQGTNVTAASSICAPNNAWTLVDRSVSVGSTGTPVIQATYSGFRLATGGIGTGTYTFGFFAGNCPNNLPGTPNLTISAVSGIAVHYTNVLGVDTNAVAASTGGPAASNFNGSAAARGWAAGAIASPTISSFAWAGTNYASLSSNCASASATTCDNTPITTAGTITDFTFNLGTNTPRNTTYQVTLMLNPAGAPGTATTTLTCQVGSRGNNCSPPTGAVAVNVGDSIQLKVVEGGVGGVDTATATTTATEVVDNYVSLSTACGSATVAPCNVTTVAAPGGFLTSASLTFSAPVPAGDTFTVTLFKNGVSSGSTCTIAATKTNCTITPANFPLATSDLLELEVTRTGGTAAFTASATTTLAETIGGTSLLAPSVTTTQPNEDVVRLFGTGSGFAAGNGLPLTVTGTSTATGADDNNQAVAGASGTQTVNNNNPDNWVAQTVALKPGFPTSIALTQLPGGYVGNANDLLLVTLAVQSLGTGSLICTPTGWTPVTTQSGTKSSAPDAATGVTQEAFWTMAANPSLTFNFGTSAGCNANGTAVAPVQAAASLVAVNYIGVDATTPLDNAIPQSTTGAASPLAPIAVTTNTPADEVVGLFASDAPTLTVSGTGVTVRNGSLTSSGQNSKAQPAPGASTPSTGTSTPANSAWASETVALRPVVPATITITYPAGYAGGAGDVLLASVSAEGLGGGGICTSAASWNLVSTTNSGAGASQLTQSTFWTTLNTGASAVFTFSTSVNGAKCTGNPLSAGASAVATNFTGVDVAVAPIASVANGTGTALTAPQIATTTKDNEIVSFFGTEDDFTGANQPTVQNPNNAWTNTGENATVQATIGNQATPSTATTANPANWAATTVALQPLIPTSITITPPNTYRAGGGNLMLVSIAAQGLGGGSICISDNTWTKLPVSTTSFTANSGTLTQQVFYTTTSTAATDTFSFYTSNTCTGALKGVPASAVVTAYTGVDPTNPIDGQFASTPPPGAASPLTAAPVTTTVPKEEVVALYASNAAALTGVSAKSTGGITSSGANDSLDNATGAYTPPGTVTSNPTAATWTEETVALRPLGQHGITISRPATPAQNDFLLVDVTANGLASGSSICAPNDGTWTQEGALVTKGTLSQALFYSSRVSANPETYTFTFRTGGCPAGGVADSAQATALAVRYTGVNPITPIDQGIAGDVYGFSTGTPVTDPGKTITPPPTSAAHTGDMQVAFYGTAATAIGAVDAPVATGLGSATGHTDFPNPVTTGAHAASSGTTTVVANWIGQTINLEAAASSCGSCLYGAEDPGGVGTDYGLAINAAETALNNAAMQPTRSNAQKVIILLSDGDATTNVNGTANPCQYGIWAAEQAESTAQTDPTKSGNTWFFSVAYGADHSSNGSCGLDTGAGKNGENLSAGLNAQCAMILMAHNKVTDPTNFSSDAQAKATLCPTTTQAASDPEHRFYNETHDSSLEDVFTQIAEQATNPRLISNNAS